MASRSGDVETTLRTIFKRCVECDPAQTPSCPTCPKGQVCSQILQTCDACARTTCVPQTLSGLANGSKQNDGPNVGAIAGGVVGGVVVIAIITYLVWRFIIKPRRQAFEEENWEESDMPTEKAGNDFTMQRDARSSTHTVGSLASSVLTRASNIIQIAYIPGVTNRSGPASPDFLVPPVPPIPIATPNSQPGSPFSQHEQHFFMPGDLRDSTYSGLSSIDGRSSYARNSISPSLARSSVATIYRNNAVVNPLPAAQTIVRGKAAVVSVKSSNTNSPAETPGANTPPVPAVDYLKHGAPQRPVMVRMPSSSDSPQVRPSPVGSVRSTATIGKPTPLNITKKGGKAPATATSAETLRPQTAADAEQGGEPKGLGVSTAIGTATTDPSPTTNTARTNRSPLASQPLASSDSDSESSSTDDEDDDPHARSRRSLLAIKQRTIREQHQATASSAASPAAAAATRDSGVTEIADTPGVLQSPFTDGSGSTSGSLPGSPEGRSPQQRPMSTVIEEATRRASRDPTHDLLSAPKGERARSPFGDEHSI